MKNHLSESIHISIVDKKKRAIQYAQFVQFSREHIDNYLPPINIVDSEKIFGPPINSVSKLLLNIQGTNKR